MDQKILEALHNNNLLKNADINKFNLGTELGRLKTVDGGEVIYKQGEKADSVYLVLNGEVNLVKKANNGNSESIIFSDNDFFGAKELFAGIDRCTTTVSLTDTYLIELTADEIKKIIEEDDKIALNVQKANYDFKFEENLIEVVSQTGAFDDLEEQLTQNDIDEMVDSIDEIEWQEFDNNIGDLEFDNLNSKEIIEKEEKFDYNYELNEEKISREYMSTEEFKSNYLSSEQFEMVIKSLQLVNANVKRDDVLTNVVDVVVNLTNADRGTLYLVDDENDEIWSKVFIGGNVEEIRLKIGEGLAGWVAENGETLNIPDVSKDDRFDSSFDQNTGYTTKNMLIYPVKNKNEEVVGVLQLLNSVKGSFGEQEELFLNAVSLNIALALENASLVEQLIQSERNASIDKMGNFLTYDLRRPLMTCKRYTEHLLKKELDFDIKRTIQLLDEELGNVSSQISAASDFTEGTTLLRKQPVNLSDAMFEFSDRIHNLLKMNNCKIEHDFHADCKINVDKKEFYQCFYNIIKNSCEALPEGGVIVVSTEKDDSQAKILINDKGIGIDPSDLKHVFDPLWSKNKKKNSGLGLSISKKIVEDHEGTISINSDKENGTTVTISLPIH